MKKFIFLLMCLLWLVNASALLAAPKPKVERDACVAVMDFGTRPGASPAEISINNAEYTSCEYIVTRFINRNCFNVIDKDMVMKKLKAEGLKTTGLIDPDTAKRIGKLLNCKYIIYGNVTNVSVSDTGASVGGGILPSGLGAGTNICTVKAHIIARMMDVDTGRIIMAAKGDGKSKSSFTGVTASTTKTFNIGNIVSVTKSVTLPVAGMGTVEVTLDSVHNAIQKAAYSTVDDFMYKLFGEKKLKV